MIKNLKNKLNKYLVSAINAEKNLKFAYAILLYEKILKDFYPDNKSVINKIIELKKRNDMSQCYCDIAGYCSRYKLNMQGEFLSHSWCKNTTEKEREILHRLKLRPDTNFFVDTYSTENICVFSSSHQYEKTKKILDIKNEILQNEQEPDFDSVKLACLGHSNKQFELIPSRDYLNIVNLNDIDAGQYSSNDWSESRGFISRKKLFPDSAKFIGYVTASWNKKYDSRIDNFHNWEDAHLLLKSKPEDKIILCGQVYCSCLYRSPYSYFYVMFPRENVKTIYRSFLKMMNIRNKRHILVPYANQMIGHKENIEEYTDHLKKNDVFGKIAQFTEDLKKFTQLKQSFIDNLYYSNRINGFYMEMYTAQWFCQKDYVYLPQNVGPLRDSWYSQKFIKERCKTWL